MNGTANWTAPGQDSRFTAHPLTVLGRAGVRGEIRRLIVISCLQKVDRAIGYAVDQSVFLGDTPGPAAGQDIFKRFGLAQPLEWISDYSLYQIQNSNRGVPVRFNPVAEVLPEFQVKNGDPFMFARHPVFLAEIRSRQ